MSREQLMQMLWGENRGKVLLLLVLSLMIGVVQLWQGLWLEPRLETTRTELYRVQEELRSNQERVAAGGEAKISGITTDLEHFYQRVPPRSGLGSFIGRLYSYAGDSGIDIDKIAYTAESVKETGLLGYQLGFTVQGSYTQLKQFIHRLENSPSLLILDKIDLSGVQKENKEIVSLQMQLQTFFREGE